MNLKKINLKINDDILQKKYEYQYITQSIIIKICIILHKLEIQENDKPKIKKK